MTEKLRADWPTPSPSIEMKPSLQFDTFEESVRLAGRRLPRSIFHEVSNGAARGITQRENINAFEELAFRPLAAKWHEPRDLSVCVLGTPMSMPVLIDPIGGLRIVHPRGGVAVAKAAGDAGVICALSNVVGHSIGTIAATATGPIWQQLYMMHGRAAAERTIEEARQAGCAALAVTVDMAVQPRRRTHMRISLDNLRRYAPELMMRPRWTLSFLRDGTQLKLPAATPSNGVLSPRYTVVWEDFTWIRQQWNGPLVIKGIINADDARRALDAGASAIIVSNHGGLGLDGVRATLRALPEVVEAVDGRAEVLIDGGIRRGSDVVKAIALGARAVLIGRPYVMGLAIAGEAGVRRVLENFRYEIDHALGLLGCPSISAVDRSYLDLPPIQKCPQCGSYTGLQRQGPPPSRRVRSVT
ncbi:MAG: alpha-hydroxy acid oxidase [Steroidobacteraceae bacterium]